MLARGASLEARELESLARVPPHRSDIPAGALLFRVSLDLAKLLLDVVEIKCFLKMF